MSRDHADELQMPVLLYVEDEPLIRELVTETLKEAGYSVLVACSGDQGLKLFNAKSETIRGLVTDINLGAGIDGWGLASAARDKKADLAVVYVSGESGHQWASRGVPNSLMITKPFAPAQVVVAISSLLVAADTAP